MHYRSKPCVATAKVRAVKCEIQISQNTIADVAKYYTNVWEGFKLEITGSVTRLGNLLDLGNFYSQLGNFCKVVKIHHFSSEIILGQLL